VSNKFSSSSCISSSESSVSSASAS
jgi:hypothetical protein